MVRPRFAKLPPAQQQAILRAALDEFAAHGFHDASLNRIIDAAGISKGSMYYYFDGKEDLFAHVTRVEFEHLFAARRARPPCPTSPGRTPSGRPWSATTSTPWPRWPPDPQLAALVRAWLAASGQPHPRSRRSRTLEQAGPALDRAHPRRRTSQWRRPHRPAIRAC